MVSRLEFQGDEEFSYLYEKPRQVVQQQWLDVVAACRRGDIADVGCGPAGIYWALGYVQRAETISFYDKDPRYIEWMHEVGSNLDPAFIAEHYWPTLLFLQEKNILTPSQTSEQLASEIVMKMQDIGLHDIRSKPLPRLYDVVLAMELLEVANEQLELDQILAHLFESLKNGGQVIGSVARSAELSNRDRIHCHGVALPGRLMLCQELLKQSFINAGFTIQLMKSVTVSEKGLYPEEILFCLNKITV